jgi:hypothetical protein
MRSAAALALFASCAQAQDWGTTGSWTRIIPTPGTAGGRPFGLPPTRVFHHAASTNGYLLVPGNDTTPGNSGLDLWVYNIANNSWVNPFAFLPNPIPLANAVLPPIPFIFTNGGTAIVVFENQPTALYYIDATAPYDSNWTTVPVNTGLSALGRVAQRFMVGAAVGCPLQRRATPYTLRPHPTPPRLSLPL